MSDQIKYYFKETTNQILVSGSSTVADMNILLNSPKDENTLLTGPATANNTVRLSSLGEITTYVIDNNGQVGGDTTITVDSDQELWLYRGWQPVGTEDANAYRYNPFLHRPYKAYILTETGGGSSSFPWSPEGLPPFSRIPGEAQLFIPDAFDEKFLASNGSETSEGINSTAVVKGNFTVTQTNRGIHPWIFTRYSAKSGTRQGSEFFIYRENFNYPYTSNYFTSLAAAFTASQPNAVIFNSGTITSITKVTLGSTSLNRSTLVGLQTNIAQGKPAGELVFTQGAAANTITGTITSVTFALVSQISTYDVGLSNVTSPSATVQYSNNTPVNVKFQDFPQYVGTPVFQQELASATNTTAETYPTINLFNALYTYTSSIFDGDVQGSNFGRGFSQFGLYADLNWSVRYQATNGTGSTVRIYYTDTTGTLKFYDLETGFIVEYAGLASPVPYFDPVSPGEGFENIVKTPFTRAPVRPISSFNTRVNDVYIAYSSSLSQSIDGLYVFNQIPQSDVQVTVSMFLNAWTGSDDGAKYGDVSEGINVNTTYSIDVSTSPDPETPPTYGAGETGDDPTWTTASIRLYTGTYPNAVPDVLDDFLYQEAFESEIIHVRGLAITASYLLPKADISLKTCLSVALQVSTGSNTPAADVKSSLVVSEYEIEFNTPGENDNDGSVPVFLDGALSGGETLANTPDCQPLYNVFVTDETLRRNPLIQEIEYNIPESFFLNENEELIPFIYPFVEGEEIADSAVTFTYTQASKQIITSGTGTGIILNISAINNGSGMLIVVIAPGSGYKNNDTLRILASTLSTSGFTNITKDLLINLNFVYGLYNPSNFQSILENTAIKSSVPESNYTQLPSILPRYLGSRTTANSVNSINGLSGGFGTLPVIDYKTAFFAYCDQVVDAYPTINNKTLLNIKYLINEGGDPKQPNLSPYTAFDIEGSWQEGGQSRVGINQISGSTQYDALNNLQPIYKVAEQVVPYFWSQTGNDSYSDSIPMSGEGFNNITNAFLQYGMTAVGPLYNFGNLNERLPLLENNFFQSSTLAANDYVANIKFTTNFNYGEVLSVPLTRQSSGSFVGGLTSSATPSFPPGNIANSYTPPNISPTPAIPTYAEVGEIFFNRDYYADAGENGLSGNDLSDSYVIKTEFKFYSSPPRSNTQAGSSDIGNIKVRLQYLDQGNAITPAPWLDTININRNYCQQIELDGDVILELYNGPYDFANNSVPSDSSDITRVNLSDILPSSNVNVGYGFLAGFASIRTQYIFTLTINPEVIENYLSGIGIDPRAANFASYKFTVKSKGVLKAQRRYRWTVSQELRGVNGSTYGDFSGRNYWNPTTVTNGQLSHDEYSSNPNEITPPLIKPAIEGPIIAASIVGNKVSIGDTSNKILKPTTGYWNVTNAGRKTLEFTPTEGTDLYVKNMTGDIYVMGTLPYTASANVLFPGGFEPSDSSFPELAIPFRFQVGDEIRFNNSEDAVYTVFKVNEPGDSVDGGTSVIEKPQIELDRIILEDQEDRNNFLMRRAIYSPNTVYLDRTFPYGTLPTIKKFVESTNSISLNEGGAGVTGTAATGSTSTTSQSGSFVEYVEPLRKSDNTPAGILFPEYPTALIDLSPDEILSQLRDNKLID